MTPTSSLSRIWGYVDAADVEAADKQEKQTLIAATTRALNTQETGQPATPPLLMESVKPAQDLLMPQSKKSLKRKAP